MTQAKGTIVVQNLSGRLRLQWSWPKATGGDGKRYWLSLGLTDDPVNRRQAELKAALIKRDIDLGQFDVSLQKYQTDSTPKHYGNGIEISKLLDKYLAIKKLSLRVTSLEKYNALLKHVQEFFGDRLSTQIDSAICAEFRDWLLKRQKPLTSRERLGVLSACFDWGISEKLLTSNPVALVYQSMTVPPQQEPEPFTRAEVNRIVRGFETDPEYAFYADFVRWLFGVGCRFGEASALQWKNLAPDCSEVWIGESIARDKQRKATKNNKARRFKLSDDLKEMLLSRRPVGYDPESLVFPARKGGSLSDRTFNDRAWRVVFEKALVPYRKPHSPHSAVSRGKK